MSKITYENLKAGLNLQWFIEVCKHNTTGKYTRSHRALNYRKNGVK